MIRSGTNRFGKTLFVLYPGDYYASADDCLIATVAGSCVVVCLHDFENRIGGMGHFILPGAMGTDGLLAGEVARHGITCMEYLIGELVKLGGTRKTMRAALYGAGNFGAISLSAQGFMLADNIKFMRGYFQLERIVVSREDLGGNLRRKIFFSPRTGASFRKFLKNNHAHSEFIKLENEYIATVFTNKEKYGSIIIFD